MFQYCIAIELLIFIVFLHALFECQLLCIYLEKNLLSLCRKV